MKQDMSLMNTKGFWAKWLLWESTSIDGAIATIRSKFGIKVSKK